jgi:hypothetical protein
MWTSTQPSSIDLTLCTLKVSTELAIVMFLLSMNAKFEASITALKTMSDDSPTRDGIATRIIEEGARISSSRLLQIMLLW